MDDSNGQEQDCAVDYTARLSPRQMSMLDAGTEATEAAWPRRVSSRKPPPCGKCFRENFWFDFRPIAGRAV